MLLDLPLLCQLEILKNLPPTSIDTSALVCQKLNALISRYRNHLPKVKVFMAITNELDGESLTICVYLHPIHYNGNMENCMKRRVYRQLTMKISDLPAFNVPQHFGPFDLESILLTSRHRELTLLSPELLNFTIAIISTQPKLRYFSARSLDFKNLSSKNIEDFLGAFNSISRLDTFKIDSCHFEGFTSIYALYRSPILVKTRQFKEICVTREHSKIEDLGSFKETNLNFLSLLQSDNHALEVVDISSSIGWPLGAFRAFIEAWITSKNPKSFRSITVMKTPEFEFICQELKTHPWRQNDEEPLIFKNKFNKNLILQVCVESLLYFTIEMSHSLDDGSKNN